MWSKHSKPKREAKKKILNEVGRKKKKGNTFSNKCTLYVTKLILPTFNKVHLELLPEILNFTT